MSSTVDTRHKIALKRYLNDQDSYCNSCDRFQVIFNNITELTVTVLEEKVNYVLV